MASMELNEWTQKLRALYDEALTKYQAGQRDAETFFDASQTAFLASIGLRPIHLYDYVEDFATSAEPDWDTTLLIIAARRDYFIHEMHREWTATPITEASLPTKTDAYDGIEWLPRIILKAQGFLKGALPPEIMYCCGGDRRFLKANNLHPADFLRMVWAVKGDPAKLVSSIRL